MSYFLIEGGVPLKGTVSISGSKNAAIKMIAAALLTEQPVTLSNVPQIEDVRVDLEVVESLGMQVEGKGSALTLHGENITSSEISEDLSSKTRAAVVTLGPLLARKGKVRLGGLGGCKIGERPIDRHLSALESLGADVSYESGWVEVKVERLRGGTIRFEKNTVMGTETALLSSVLAKGKTDIYGAALEPEVDDLIEFLKKMGANIRRGESEPRHIIVEGVE